MTALGRGRFARGIAGRFTMELAPRFTAGFALVFAPARAGRRVLAGHHSYEWHVTDTTCGWDGGRSLRCR